MEETQIWNSLRESLQLEDLPVFPCEKLDLLLRDVEVNLSALAAFLHYDASYLSKIKIVCADRDGLVLEVANLVSDTRVSLKSLNARSTKDSIAIVEITVDVRNTDQINMLIKNLNKLKDVIEVSRDN